MTIFPAPLHRLVGRIFAPFKPKHRPLIGYYSIMVANSNGFSIQSSEFVVNSFNSDTFLPELMEFIKERHKLEHFSIITLVFYPPNRVIPSKPPLPCSGGLPPIADENQGNAGETANNERKGG
jgi:hypothetical protein